MITDIQITDTDIDMDRYYGIIIKPPCGHRLAFTVPLNKASKKSIADT